MPRPPIVPKVPALGDHRLPTARLPGVSDQLIPVPATAADAAEVLVLQRCCWVSEAIANSTMDIPPLHESLEAVRGWLPMAWVLRDGGRLIGAVRGYLDADSWQIGRLMVAPDRQGEGLGGLLLRHIESQAPAGTRWHVLFTGAGSLANQARYRHGGYQEFKAEDGLVYLRKPAN